MGAQSKEKVYKKQLVDLGTYEEAFEAAIKEMCILERELSRGRKQLKAKHTGKDKKVDAYGYLTDPLYGVLLQMDSKVLAYKDALGLTPKGLKKLKGKGEDKRPAPASTETPLSLLTNRRHDRKSNSTA